MIIIVTIIVIVSFIVFIHKDPFISLIYSILVQLFTVLYHLQHKISNIVKAEDTAFE